MDVKELAKWVKQHNQIAKGWSWTAAVGYVCLLLIGSDFGGKILWYGIALFLEICFMRHRWSMYLCVRDGDGIVAEPLYKIAAYHAFAEKEYFSYVQKKMIPWIFGFSICFPVIGIANETSWRTGWAFYVPAVICNLLILYGWGFLEKYWFSYKSREGYSHKEYLWSALKIIPAIAEILLVAVSFAIGMMLIWAMASSFFSAKIEQEQIVIRSYPHSLSVFLFMILGEEHLLEWMGVFCTVKLKKWKKPVILVMLAVSIALFFGEIHVYTEYCEDRIIVSDLSGKKEYTMADIVSFEIYSKKDSIQMKVSFADGNQTNLIGASLMETSDTYDETYFSDYHFAADIVKKWKEKGIEGTIRDEKKLRKHAKDLDDRMLQALDEILEEMK